MRLKLQIKTALGEIERHDVQVYDAGPLTVLVVRNGDEQMVSTLKRELRIARPDLTALILGLPEGASFEVWQEDSGPKN